MGLGAAAVVVGAVALVGTATLVSPEKDGATARSGPVLSVPTNEDGTVPPLSYDQAVTGRGFVAGQAVRIFQCPSAAPANPAEQCMVAGETRAAPDGSFEVKALVSAGMETKGTYCAPVGTSQCYLLAATYHPVTGLSTSHARRHLCFSEDFVQVYFAQQYVPSRQPHEPCAPEGGPG